MSLVLEHCLAGSGTCTADGRQSVLTSLFANAVLFDPVNVDRWNGRECAVIVPSLRVWHDIESSLAVLVAQSVS